MGHGGGCRGVVGEGPGVVGSEEEGRVERAAVFAPAEPKDQKKVRIGEAAELQVHVRLLGGRGTALSEAQLAASGEGCSSGESMWGNSPWRRRGMIAYGQPGVTHNKTLKLTPEV